MFAANDREWTSSIPDARTYYTMRIRMLAKKKRKLACCGIVAAICFFMETMPGSAQSATDTIADEQTASSSASTPDAPTANHLNLAERWAKYYTDDWSGKSASSDPAPQKRGLPAPLGCAMSQASNSA